MAKGLDFTQKLTADKAKQLKADGYDFVCRYFANPQYVYKCLKPDEAKFITDAGLNIATVYENGAKDMTQGEQRGKEDAKHYLSMAQQCGQPHGTAAYFAADFEAHGQDFDSIEYYLKGAKSILPQYIVRPYGDYDVIEEMVRRGVCDGGWMTYGWSAGKLSKYAFIYQYHNGVNVEHISADADKSYGNEGWWNLNMKDKLTNFPDVPTGSWYEEAVKTVSDKGLMNGYPDGIFKPNQPVTRAELASVLVKLKLA